MSTLALHVSFQRPDFMLEVQHELALEGITALFGPSGSGKTTLLRVIAGLERSARGSVTFDGTAWQSTQRWLPPHDRGVGYVFQDGRLFPHLTVQKNLEFAARRATRRKIDFDAVVAAFDLTALLGRRPGSLSGGEQQRVAIARALLTSPQLLLMDEPLSSLDIGRKREILPLIEQLPLRFGVPVLYVTHNVDEVARLASHVLLLAGGRVAAYGTVAEIFERTDLEPYTGGLEAGTVLRTQVAEHRNGVATLTVGEERLHVPMHAAPIGAVRPIRIHARDVAIATERPRNLSIRNVLAAKILRIEPSATGNVDLLLDIHGEHLRSRITRDACDELELKLDQHVFALIKSVALESTLLG
ncbi:MAG: molybdenum ABC transporter ATP-binding protein [Gammaproteobacteria bacterium]